MSKCPRIARISEVESRTTATVEAFRPVFTTLVGQPSGEPRAKTPAVKEMLGILW